MVIFIVAGPAAGFALWQIYFHIASFAQFDKDIFNIKYEFQREYERLRLVCDDKERAELDSLDGRHIFGNSTAIGLAIIGLYALGLVYPYLLSGHSTNCMYLMPDKAFYLVISLSTIAGLAVNLLNLNLIKALVYANVMNGIVAIPVLVAIIRIANDKKILGLWINGKISNIIGWCTVVMTGIIIIIMFLGINKQLIVARQAFAQYETCKM